MNTLPTSYMPAFFLRAAKLDRRRQPRRAIGRSPQLYTKLNPIYTY